MLPGGSASAGRRRSLLQAGSSLEATDPLYGQDGLNFGQWWLRQINAPQAWAKTTGSKQVGRLPRA